MLALLYAAIIQTFKGKFDVQRYESEQRTQTTLSTLSVSVKHSRCSRA